MYSKFFICVREEGRRARNLLSNEDETSRCSNMSTKDGAREESNHHVQLLPRNRISDEIFKIIILVYLEFLPLYIRLPTKN